MKYITTINEKGNVALDDKILYKNIPCTAGSKMLEKFIPLHNAEIADRLEKAGYVISGKVNVGEFGFDLLGETSYFGAEKDENGNLVSPSSLLVKSGLKGVVATELNGASLRGAALGGTVFVKPTYGTVSRYGIIPCACSSEQAGVHTSTVEDAIELLSVIAGHDGKDGTSLPKEKYDYSVDGDVSGKKVCVPQEYYDKASSEIKAKIDKTVAALKEKGAEVEFVSFAQFEAAQSAWFIMMCAESCNNLSRYDGVKFGHRADRYKDIDELYTNSRTEGFGLLSKAVVLYGSDVLSKNRYFSAYDKALKVRRALRSSLDELFAKYDIILAPATSKTEYSSADLKVVYEETYFTSLAMMMGLPTVAVKGVQLIGNSFEENKLFSAAKAIEEVE
jgi:aspartyl-tRNA(Asn)/glutamyl-tRNA(Gln) amidotransferase subunit A